MKEAPDYLPAWSPDGTRLAFTSSRDGNEEFYIVNRDGSGLRRLTNSPSVEVTPTWSPTGNQLAFVSDRTGSRRSTSSTWTAPTEADHQRDALRPTHLVAGAVQRDRVHVTGGRRQRHQDLRVSRRCDRTITDSIGSNESPAFSPNGRHIAFASDRTGRSRSTRSIAMARPPSGYEAGAEQISELVTVTQSVSRSRSVVSKRHEAGAPGGGRPD